MASNVRIGVVTVTYNSGGVVPDFLCSIEAQRLRNFLLFAVDNGSQDSTVTQLQQWPDKRLRLIENARNVGVAEGNNQGIRAALAAGCETILLLNNDTVFEEHLFGDLDEGLVTFDADMICPKMMYFDEPNRVWAAGGAFQPWLGYRTKHLGADTIDTGQRAEATQITYVPTCCVLIKTELFLRIGLMDAKYFVYVDDVDFMFRALRAGAKLIYLPSAKLLHKVGRLTGGKESTFAAKYIARNRMYFLLKNFGLLRTLPFIFLYQSYYCARLLLRMDNLKMFKLKQSALLEGLRMGG